MAYITGLDGACSLSADNFAKFNTWSATISRAVNDITAFADPAKRRKLGMLDLTGSAGGHMQSGGAEGFDPGLDLITTGGSGERSVVLTAATGCTITADCVVDSIAISSDANGDATVTFNFQLSGGALPAIAWVEA